jgi:hypothetical protein
MPATIATFSTGTLLLTGVPENYARLNSKTMLNSKTPENKKSSMKESNSFKNSPKSGPLGKTLTKILSNFWPTSQKMEREISTLRSSDK